MITPSTFKSKLSPSDSVRISAFAVALQGEYGALSELARSFEISRPTVYAKLGAGREALENAFAESDLEKVYAAVQVDDRMLKRAIVGAYVEGPNSVRDVQALLRTFYGVHVGYGKIHQTLAEAERKAAAFNRSVSLEGIATAALDELFSQGDPVLAGIDLDTDYLFLLEHCEGRGGEDWAAALRRAKEQGLDLETVVKDAGKGLAAGTTAVFPDAEQRDDCFHAIWKLGQVQQWLEKKGWSQMAELIDAEEAFQEAQRKGHPLYSPSQKLRRTRERYQKVVKRHDEFEKLKNEALDAMQFVGFTGNTRRTGAQQAAKLEDIADRMAALGGKKIKSVAIYLKNRAPGLAAYIDALWEKLETLAEEIGGDVVVASCQLWRRAQELRRASHWNRRHHLEAAGQLIEQLIALAGDKVNASVEAVCDIIARRHRASSAIENFNSVLRPYLHVHKSVSQGFLDLFRAWRNLRTRAWGRHKGTSAHELVTGEKVTDWLSMLGYPPSKKAH